MFTNRHLAWMTLAVALLFAALLGGCDVSNSDGLTSQMLTGVAEDDDGFTLIADPPDIVIDTTTEPPQESGQTTLKAEVLDPDQGTPLEGVEVRFSSDAGTLASNGDPVLTDVDGMATDTLNVELDDPDEIQVTAVDSAADRMETILVAKTVVYPNRPPEADAGQDQQENCTGADGAMVTLDGSGSTDPDSTAGTNDDIVSFEWYEFYGTSRELPLGEGEMLDVTLGYGSHDITLLVTDSEGETDTDEVAVEIIDTLPPRVRIMMDPSTMWPPNHKLWPVQAEVAVRDCSPVTVELISVTSNEPPNANGDGNTEPDIFGVSPGTEDYDFELRAERAGGGNGRIYTVVYEATDAEGHFTSAEGYVKVPHDQGGM